MVGVGAIATAGRSATATTITLAGFDLYTSDASGNNASGNYRFSSNANDQSFAEKLTTGAASQSKGIAFDLADGDNTFTFAPDPDVNNGHGDHPNTNLAGIDLFFTGDGTSFNPTTTDTPGIAGNLVVFAPTTKATTFSFAGQGISAQDYQDQGVGRPRTAGPRGSTSATGGSP